VWALQLLIVLLFFSQKYLPCGCFGCESRSKRGVHPGDPISPLLFDFMADALSALLDAATIAGHIKAVVPHLI
jgi:hypothetical protein